MPTGEAIDGEVEDYVVTIRPVPTPLNLTIQEDAINENAGTATATVSRDISEIGEDLLVLVSTDDYTELEVPQSVVIATGETEATFTFNAFNDQIVDGTQTATLFVDAEDHLTASDTIEVTDDDSGLISIGFFDHEISENGGQTTGILIRNTNTTLPLEVQLTSTDTSELIVPDSVQIPAGSTFATFVASAVDDDERDDDQLVRVDAEAPNHFANFDEILVLNDEPDILTLSFDSTTIQEQGGEITATATRNGNLESEQAVEIVGDNERLQFPESVTFPATQDTIEFTIQSIDNTVSDGNQALTVLIRAEGYTVGADAVEVIDDEVATLTLSLQDDAVSENGGTTTATVSTNVPVEREVTVSLSTDSPIPGIVPDSVTIPVGESNTQFSINAGLLDNTIVDAARSLGITASADDQVDGLAALSITDDDLPTLALQFSASEITEQQGTVVTLTRNTHVARSLDVQILTDATQSSLSFPTVVTIPIDAASVTFTATGITDNFVDADQTVSLTADAPGFFSATDSILVTNIDAPTLTVDWPVSLTETDEPREVTVMRNTAANQALTVNLNSEDRGELEIIESVTIAENQSSATFLLSPQTDLQVDGDKSVAVSANADQFAESFADILVIDADTPELTLTSANSQLVETDQSATVTLSRNTDVSQDLIVTLSAQVISDEKRRTVRLGRLQPPANSITSHH